MDVGIDVSWSVGDWGALCVIECGKPIAAPRVFCKFCHKLLQVADLFH